MKPIFRICIAFAYLLIPVFGSAQNSGDFTKQIEVIPPSPVSYQMSKYGGINLSMISGSPNISIPLLNYNVKSLSVPISLKYTSNGIKVDQIAGRTGMGFDFEAGGMITRIVYGQPDERGPSLAVPSNLSNPSPELLNFFTLASDGADDTQPDLYNFSFAGYSGKFIIVGGVVKQLVKSELKIIPNAEGYGFKIIAPNGNKYYFGGPGAIELSDSETTCSRKTGYASTTGWNLKKIVAYTGEEINFTYQLRNCKYTIGVNETITQKQPGQLTACANGTQLFPEEYTFKFCANILDNTYNLLTEISSNLSGLVKFSYSPRTDVAGEYLLSKIRYFANTDSTGLQKSFVFNYIYGNSGGASYINSFNSLPSFQYRPFLSSLEERAADDALVKRHAFAYEDINGLPNRLSFSQDLYGYFNGKNNINHIVPSHELHPYLADRSPDPDFAKKGLLTKITYPTGGSDSIVYEPNTIYKIVNEPNTTTASASGTGLDYADPQSHGSGAFVPAVNVTALLSVACQYTKDDYRTSYHYIKAEIIDETTNTVIYTKNKTIVGETVAVNVNLVAGHSYVLRATCYGEGLDGTMSISFDNPTSIAQNVNAPGLRIQKILTKSGATDPIQVHRYYYGTPESGYMNSSGTPTSTPEYYALLKRTLTCMDPSGLPAEDRSAFYNLFYSNSTNTQYLQQTPIQYETVAESLGENFDNGGSVSQFLLRYDNLASNIHGNGVSGAPLSNYGTMNGLEIKKIDYQKKDGLLKAVKMVTTHYAESDCHDFASSCVLTPVYGYVVRRNFPNAPRSGPVVEKDLEPFDAARYEIRGYWFYADTVKTTTYDIEGNNSLVETVVSQYANTAHTQPTTVKKVTSAQQESTIEYQYPYDKASITGISSLQLAALDTLTSKNRVSTPVQIVQKLDGTEIDRIRIDYKDWGNSLVLPEYYKASTRGAALEDRVTFYQYDVNGNLLSQSLTNGPKTSYLWGYGGQYPIAEVKNSSYSAVESVLGNANIEAFRVALNPTSISLTNFLAPLKTNPTLKDALVSTFIYAPLIGLTSQTDAKGLTTYFEYDPYGRLLYVRDQDKNIIKSYDYHYKN